MSLAVVPVLSLLVLVFLAVGAARAEPHVFFDPASATLQPGETIELSFRIDACGDSISGFQLYVSFDPAVVELVSSAEGSLYAYSGYPTWFIPEEEEPGLWHFFDTVMGTGTYVTPPGELLHLEFEALDYGDTEVHIESILLADIDRENLPVGSYEHAHIFVVPLTGVEEGGGTARLGPAYPNPFTAGTAVPFYAPGSAGDAVAEIYDVRGRLVRRIPVPTGALEGELAWDGRDERGQVVPSSVYFLRMTTRTSTGHCRLVKTE
jgi:hypothetical protein